MSFKHLEYFQFVLPVDVWSVIASSHLTQNHGYFMSMDFSKLARIKVTSDRLFTCDLGAKISSNLAYIDFKVLPCCGPRIKPPPPQKKKAGAQAA